VTLKKLVNIKANKKILRIITTLDPSYGGPSNAIISSTLMLKKKGYDVEILTSDLKNQTFYKKKDIKIYNIGSHFFSKSFNFNIFFWLLKNRFKYTHFVIHGIWEINSLAARILLKKKYYIFTHGMFNNFFSTKKFKSKKKKIYWKLIERKNLILSNSILLTSKLEKKSLVKTYVNTLGIKKKVINYGIIKPNFNKKIVIKNFYKKFPKLKNVFFLIYIGRFHEKKGCDIIIQSLKKISNKNFDLKLFLAGPNNSYKGYLKNLTKNLNLDKKIIWSGAIYGDLKWGAISASNGMVLCSHGENFGVSIAESLSCSKPVIISNKVNIYKEIHSSKSGFVTKDNIQSFSKALIKFIKLNKRSRLKMSTNALACFKKYFDIEKSENGLEKIFK